MKFFHINYFLAVFCLLLHGICSSAQTQQPKDPAQKEKELREAIETMVDNMTRMLDLDIAQVFYLDSILVNDFSAMQEEMESMSKSKVANADIYIAAQDKWMEQMYQSIHGILNEEQWAKYLKSGAAREKKARDKRAAKADNQ